MGVKTGSNRCTNCYDAGNDHVTPGDIVIRTSDGQSVLAHSSILVCNSRELDPQPNLFKQFLNFILHSFHSTFLIFELFVLCFFRLGLGISGIGEED